MKVSAFSRQCYEEPTMPRILSHSLENRHHRRAYRRSAHSSALSSMTMSCDDESHGNQLSWGADTTRIVGMSHWPATVTPPFTSPCSSMTLSNTDSASISTEESFSTNKQQQPITKRRRVLSVSTTMNQYGNTPSLTRDEGGDDWGHFVDVEEEEQKIVRHSRILSRGSSFLSVVSER